ncbi:hypothetical protein F9C07_2231478 [Aspergillus flavus]|uniref:Uncharacterized protein n=2 Tax=Aspergillus flavus TaxID=5059 RepID=A0A7U2QW03_ASPFN|nr:hypothetical protein AFLA_005968 [Aspergillus flavus NRRL3357]KAJ1709323.1 hypothetical protein NYO67_8524 [Aspergillus flavus]QRD86639.1 hypothetical protein F9C07_2231478 [Aspergillus flavus]RAQ62576.1 hypothetical protein COH20_010503 [Aspergillus flavus]RAQ78530.1 hypothetical protein COH21_007088 [Aspergillus flavus]
MTWQTLKNRLYHRPNNATILALMNLIANTVSRWLDRNSADWLNQIMLVVNGIAVVGVVLREARRSTSDPGVGRIDDDQTGVGEKESLVGAGAEQCP